MSIRDLSGQNLLEQLNTGKMSVLYELGAGELHDEMNSVGKLCSFIANRVCREKNDSKLRKRACRTVKPLLPATLKGDFPDCDDAIIIGFNHPSLGEIFRLLYLGFEKYPDREFLFPVNIPWYENMVGIIPQLKRMKISLVPMITPSTEKKLKEKFAGDEEKLKDVQYIKTLFERRYMRTAKQFAEDKGIIVVAPSATRQAVVISDHIHPTMTILAHMVFRKEETRALFVPVAIIEPKNNDRKANLFKMYEICPCEPFETEEVKTLTDKSRDFDLEFLKRIDAVYRKEKKS